MNAQLCPQRELLLLVLLSVVQEGMASPSSAFFSLTGHSPRLLYFSGSKKELLGLWRHGVLKLSSPSCLNSFNLPPFGPLEKLLDLITKSNFNY